MSVARVLAHRRELLTPERTDEFSADFPRTQALNYLQTSLKDVSLSGNEPVQNR